VDGVIQAGGLDYKRPRVQLALPSTQCKFCLDAWTAEPSTLHFGVRSGAACDHLDLLAPLDGLDDEPAQFVQQQEFGLAQVDGREAVVPVAIDEAG
jgi:hypothetical protein